MVFRHLMGEGRRNGMEWKCIIYCCCCCYLLLTCLMHITWHWFNIWFWYARWYGAVWYQSTGSGILLWLCLVYFTSTNKQNNSLLSTTFIIHSIRIPSHLSPSIESKQTQTTNKKNFTLLTANRTQI